MIDRAWDYGLAIAVADSFLSRWKDRFTRNLRDDLAQEAAVEVWRCRERVRHPARLDAFVRTVSRRLRCRAMREQAREAVRLHDRSVWDRVSADDRRSVLRIGSEWRDARSMLEFLEQAMARLSTLNRQLLRGFYEGFSCSELAERYGIPESSVKVRLYRSRRRLRTDFAARSFGAGCTLGAGQRHTNHEERR
jgi:RNA polymerase sigma-70 factor (ECF subfamily)